MDLYVGNLPYDIGEEEIAEAFGAHGTVEKVTIINDRDTGRPKGFAFVAMPDDEEGQKALEEMEGFELNGRPLKVNTATPREERPQRGGGGYRDNRGGGGYRDNRGGGGGYRDNRGGGGGYRDNRGGGGGYRDNRGGGGGYRDNRGGGGGYRDNRGGGGGYRDNRGGGYQDNRGGGGGYRDNRGGGGYQDNRGGGGYRDNRGGGGYQDNRGGGGGYRDNNEQGMIRPPRPYQGDSAEGQKWSGERSDRGGFRPRKRTAFRSNEETKESKEEE